MRPCDTPATNAYQVPPCSPNCGASCPIQITVSSFFAPLCFFSTDTSPSVTLSGSCAGTGTVLLSGFKMNRDHDELNQGRPARSVSVDIAFLMSGRNVAGADIVYLLAPYTLGLSRRGQHSFQPATGCARHRPHRPSVSANHGHCSAGRSAQKGPEKARIRVDKTKHGLLIPHVNSRARLLDRSVSSICR